MAVVITSKFYQESVWKDISKIVFTSPNMVSPSIAGTRSHILPGEGNLGTWYEDTSYMYRIEDLQSTTSSDFYNYRMLCKDETDLQAEVGYIDVKNLNYDGFDTYIKENTGVEVIGYKDSTGFITSRATRLEYTPLQKNLNEIHIETDDQVEEVVSLQEKLCTLEGSEQVYVPSYKKTITRNYGWYTLLIAEFPQCYITFTFQDPTKITALSMDSLQYRVKEETWSFDSGDSCSSIPAPSVTNATSNYFIGNFTIKSSNDNLNWTTLYTGTNTTNLTKFIYLSNTQYYKYYRLDIASNTALTTTFDKSYYGVRGLRFYTYDFSTDSGTGNIALYEFNDLDNPKILRISNAYPQEATTPTVTNTSTDKPINGSITMSVVTGTPNYSSYNVSLKSTTDPYDYLNAATCVAPTVSGVGVDVEGQAYTKEDKINVVVDAAVEYMNAGLPTEYLLYTSQGSTTVQVDTAEWVGESEITYTTIASGVALPGTNFYTMSGYTTRDVESSLYSRRESFRLVIDEYTTNSGIIEEDAPLYVWGYNDRLLDLDTKNSIVFEVTTGEAYNCRLTAWDDVTHSTIINELIQGDHVRCSAMAYCCTGGKLDPLESKTPLNLVYPPAHNRIFKGNVNIGGYKHFYGDFDLVYRYQTTVYGDFLMFKPMLYGIDTDISYGVHDYIITLHYSYT